MRLIDHGTDWVLYKSDFIESYQREIIEDLNTAYENFKNVFVNVDSSLTRRQELTFGDLPQILQTKDHNFIENEMNNPNSNLSGYSFYNVFALTAPSPYFYEIQRQLKSLIRLSIGDATPAWYQCWMNFHRPDTVLDWHDHHWDYHGYISIDPKETVTKFRNGDDHYEIVNKPGQIYFGPGYREHKVFVNEDFKGPRITLGYDVTLRASIPDSQFSLIPLP
jgi:hypothetical protein